MRVIAGKGGTAFGPAGATASLLHALMSRSLSVVPASVVLQGEYGIRNIALSVPVTVSEGRILRVEDWSLDPEEVANLQAAAHDLGEFAEDASVVLGLAVRHTTLEKVATSAAR